MAHRPTPLLGNPPQSLCLLRLSAIGDCCHMVPVVRTLQAAWPDTRLTWIVGRTEAALVGDLEGVEFISYDKRAGLAGYPAVRQSLRGRAFDVLLLAQVALRAGILSTTVRSPLRLGFDRDRARDGHGYFINHRIAEQPRAHVIDGFFGFLEAMGLEARVMRWDIPVPEAAERLADELIGDRPTLIISPCSSQRIRNFRNWRTEHYARIAEYAHARGLQVIVTGGPSAEETHYGEAIERLSVAPVLNYVGRTGLKELFALLRRATAVLSPDSGPVHMAVAAGTPVVGLYATSNPERTGPTLGRQWVVNAYPEAVRRGLSREVPDVRWGRRVRDPNAMDLITVEAVRARLDALLTTPPEQRLTP